MTTFIILLIWFVISRFLYLTYLGLCDVEFHTHDSHNFKQRKEEDIFNISLMIPGIFEIALITYIVFIIPAKISIWFVCKIRDLHDKGYRNRYSEEDRHTEP